ARTSDDRAAATIDDEFGPVDGRAPAATLRLSADEPAVPVVGVDKAADGICGSISELPGREGDRITGPYDPGQPAVGVIGEPRDVAGARAPGVEQPPAAGGVGEGLGCGRRVEVGRGDELAQRRVVRRMYSQRCGSTVDLAHVVRLDDRVRMVSRV